MHSKINSHKTKGSHNVWLYSTVYLSKVSLMLVIFLFASFFIQPIHQAFANEEMTPEGGSESMQITTLADPVFDDAEDETQEPEDNGVSQTETEGSQDESTDGMIKVTEDSSEEVAGNNQDIEDASGASTTDIATESGAQQAASPTPNEVATPTSETGVASSDVTAVSPTSTSTSTPTSTSTSTSTSTGNSGGSSGSVSTVDNATTDDDIASTTSTSTNEVSGTSTNPLGATQEDDTSNGEGDEETEEITTTDTQESEGETADTVGQDVIKSGVSNIVDEVVTLTRQLVTEENYYQFSRQSCAPIGGGTFHCSQDAVASVDADSIAYAEQVDGADMEIFLRTSKGTVKQITDNQYEDTAPDYSPETKSLVWQRLIDGRYQIISYDIENEKEAQLTFSRTNNMDPKVAKEGIVWQAWDGDDWEIIFFDGKFTNVITDNDAQDVTPVIEDGYVLWSILGDSEQEARVYSIESGETLAITGYEGGAIANPRFVLVYDTKFDNGDVVTQGFDPATGLSAPIAAKPADAPVNIPEADPVGEIRALIQNKSTEKDNDIVKVPVTDADDTNTASSSSDSSNLNLSPAAVDQGVDMEAATSTETITPAFELTEFDLVITPTATSTSFTDIEREYPPLTDKVSTSTQE